MQQEFPYIKRDIFDSAIKYLNSGKILIFRGPRQVGKTTIMYQILATLQDKKTIFLNADDPSIQKKISTAQDLIKYLEFEVNYQQGEEIFVFIDEFQAIPQAGLLLKNIYDGFPNIHLICSGSSSLEITKNTEFLTGRKFIFDVRPLSFREYLRTRAFKHAEKHFSTQDFQAMVDFHQFYEQDLTRYFEEYLAIGGYPEIVLSQGEYRKRISAEIVQTYIAKDIVAFLRVENISAFNALLKILAGQIGNLANKSELAATLGISINTLVKYLDILEGTFVLEMVRPYFQNTRKELSKMPKVYFYDLGLRNFILYSDISSYPSQDIGQLVENFIYNELKQQNPVAVNFYRTISGSEIDFVVQKTGGKLLSIEAKYRTKTNYPESMKNFQKNYEETAEKGIIFTKNFIQDTKEVYFLPAYFAGLCDV